MGLPSVTVILIFVFLLDIAAGSILFSIFRWVADRNPPAESLQLGLIAASGSLAYFLTCRLVARLGAYLKGVRMPFCSMVISILALILLSINSSVWAMYLLWPMLLGSWALVFPSITGWLRYGRSGRALRNALFLYCLAWMTGVTFGALLSSRLYALDGPDIGATYVYLSCIAIYVVCLVVLAIPASKPTSRQETLGQQPHSEDVDPKLAEAFMRVGWLGNILLMLCVAVLFSLFNKLATDHLEFPPSAHGWLIVIFRIAQLTTAGLMIVSLFWHHHWWGYLLAQMAAVVGMCILGLANDYWLFVLGFVLCGIMVGHNYYAGVYYSLNSVSSTDAAGQRGKAAMNESFFPMGAIIGAGLGGLAGWFSVRLPYFLAAATVVTVLIFQLNTIRKARTGKQVQEKQ